MNVKIRKGAFETNSSSTHSISIDFRTPVESLEELRPFLQPPYEYSGGEFGWDWYTYHQMRDRIRYAVTYAMMGGEDSSEAEMLREVLAWGASTPEQEVSPEEISFVPSGSDWYQFGYIDHQSYDVAAEAFEDEETLKRFLFSDRSFFGTGNDNS